ncbi:MAG TPA: 3-hydroxyacyl-CoA dehydrogenase NAD-binding domain-containing protein [Nocardioidaceae bacterium]|nr:3-hydroxyacyl-CoA dehydrogenase NAD-binding domain-containing protein [Nocardioidaceae bacterium]
MSPQAAPGTDTTRPNGQRDGRQDAVHYQRDEDGVVTLLLDDPQQSVNTMNPAYVASMGRAVAQLQAERHDIAGVVVASAKKSFFAGGDLAGMSRATPEDAAEVFAQVEEVKRQLRALETLGRPVVAALNGTALGGGLEIALACQHRIAVARSRAEFGLPEVTFGLLPGGGGVTRTVRMLGLERALTTVLLEGPRMSPDRALAAGLVDRLVDDADDLLPAARAWILEHSDDEDARNQPWDRDGYRIPGGTPSTPKLAQRLPAFPATLRKQTKGAPYTAPRSILAAAVEGAQVDVDTASRIESRYLVDLICHQQFKNMTQAFFFDMQAIGAGASRPRGHGSWRPSKVAVLGAGMMGAGIAYSFARAGIDVVLKDTDTTRAEKGKAYAQSVQDKAISAGRSTEEKRDALVGRITATDSLHDLAGCDLVIEAVFEDAELKHRVLSETESAVAADALLASNTSTLPIGGLARGVERRSEFLGLHFFSPVEKMPLVEIIVGPETSEAALARAYDVVQAIGKTPIVVGDSRGFFTSRVFGTLVLEAAAMLGEGCNPVSIERAAAQAGFPAPPLAMLDELTLTLPRHIEAEARKAAEAEGLEHVVHPGMTVLDRMVEEHERIGKASGAGFYDYPDDGPKRLWPGLWDAFAAAVDGDSPVPFREMQERLTFAMAIETQKCLDEGVLHSTAAANVGSVLGIGFPPLHGGAAQFVRGYEGPTGTGPEGFVARARQLAEAYGDRFVPPPSLLG